MHDDAAASAFILKIFSDSFQSEKAVSKNCCVRICTLHLQFSPVPSFAADRYGINEPGRTVAL